MQHTNLQNMGLNNHEVDSSHEFAPVNRQRKRKKERKTQSYAGLLRLARMVKYLMCALPAVIIYLFNEFANSAPSFHVSQFKFLFIIKFSKAIIAILF